MLAAPASSLGAGPPVSFAPPITTEMPNSGDSLTGSLATADFNDDGHDDVVAYAGRVGFQTLQFAMSKVTGGSVAWEWEPLPTPPVAGGFANEAVATAQMNPGTDSDPDVVALGDSANEGESLLAVYLGGADGTFAVPVYTPVPGFASGLAVGDVNGDGISDALISTVVETVTGRWRAEVVTLLGRGNGEFEPPIESPFAEVAEPFEIEPGGS